MILSKINIFGFTFDDDPDIDPNPFKDIKGKGKEINDGSISDSNDYPIYYKDDNEEIYIKDNRTNKDASSSKLIIDNTNNEIASLINLNIDNNNDILVSEEFENNLKRKGLKLDTDINKVEIDLELNSGFKDSSDLKIDTNINKVVTELELNSAFKDTVS